MVHMSRIAFDWLEKIVTMWPEKTALVDLFTNRSYTYRQFNIRANRLATAWQAKWGILKGDRVAILAKNCTEFLEAYFAAQKIGAILVPINCRLTGPEILYMLNDSSPKGMVLGEDFLWFANSEKSRIKFENFLLLDGAAAEGMTSYEDFLQYGQDGPPDLEEPISLDDPHLIIYTSGTTGNPKGSIQTHGNILFNSLNANLALDLVSTDVFLCSLPLFHTGGLHVQTTPTLHTGATILIMRSFDAGEILRIIHEKIINTLFLVATMWQFMLEHEDFHKTDFSGLRMAWSGGASCPLPVLEGFQKKGVLLRQGYGLSEVGPDATILSAEDGIRKIGSSGRTTFHTELKIFDENDREVARGEKGEIVLRGPTVTPGYWNNPEETKEALRGGWFHTGDLAREDEDGFIFIVGRKKEMIISGGENIYPSEIEKVLYAHPKLAEVAVIGVQDEKWGEVGHAVVCPRKSEEITEQEVLDFMQGKLARYKIPKYVSFRDTLPKNASGKILKRVLKEELHKS